MKSGFINWSNFFYDCTSWCRPATYTLPFSSLNDADGSEQCGDTVDFPMDLIDKNNEGDKFSKAQ